MKIQKSYFQCLKQSNNRFRFHRDISIFYWKALFTDCPTLTAPTDGSLSTIAVTTGTTVTVSCDPSFTLDGATTLQCQTDGTWDNTVGVCRPGIFDLKCSPTVLVTFPMCLFQLSNARHEKTCFCPMRTTKAHPRSLISAFVVHCLDSIIPLLAIAEISRL